jgi:antitoxin VapB
VEEATSRGTTPSGSDESCVESAQQNSALPKEYQFSTAEVFIRKEGEDVILSPRPRDWGPYLETASVASEAFMADVEDLPVQEREG